MKPPSRRPTTRANAAGKAPTTRVPASSGGRPATGRISARREAAPRGNSSTPILIGGGVGGLILVIVVIAVFSGGSKRPADASSKSKAPAPVDVAGLEREAQRKCDEGLLTVQKTEDRMTGRMLSGTERAQLKAELERGLRLLTEGNNLFEQANQKSGNMYDTVKYNKAIKAARMKIGELGSAK
jgi:hypothetical protein